MMRVRGLALTGLSVVCAAAGVLGAISAPAWALFEHKYITQLGEVPEGGPGVIASGPIAAPWGLSSDKADNVYVVDRGHSVVDEFNSSNEFVRQFSSAGLASSAELAEGHIGESVAVDSATGEVYVDNEAESAVEVFSATGEHLAKLTGAITPQGTFGGGGQGLAVDAATEELYVTNRAYPNFLVNVLKVGPGGKASYVTQFKTESFAEGIAVNEANGDVVVAGEAAVEVFRPTAPTEYESLFHLTGTPGGRIESLFAGVAIGANGDIYVSSSVYTEGEVAIHAVLQFTSSGSYVDEVTGTSSGPFPPPGEGLKHDPQGLSVAPSGDLYVAVPALGVFRYGPTLTLPDVSAGLPSSLRTSSATFTGTVEPHGAPVSACQFEYGTENSGSFEATAPCASSPGSSSGPVAVSAEASGLAPGTVYHYRLSATGEEGVTITSIISQTAETAPAVEGFTSVSGVTSFAATLTGVLQPGEITPEYHFAYGLTSAYGSVWPQPDATADIGGQQAVSQTVTGLQPDTTYHYALVAGNFGGGETVGPDATFTTRPLVPPGVVTGGAEGIGGTTATLTGSIDPEGLPTSYRFEYGTSTAYGSSWPLVQVFASSGSTADGIAVAVPNLQPGTVYHYRLVASSEDGTTYGADQTFATVGYLVSAVPEPLVLTAKLGFVNPEAGHSSGKASRPKGRGRGKGKKKSKHGKTKQRKRGKRKG